MSDTTDEKPKTYDSSMRGLRSAAEEIAPPESEVAKVELGDDVPAELTTREAGKELDKHRERVAAEQDAVRKAMGVDVPEPTEQERLEARLARLEESTSDPLRIRESDADAHYQQGQQQLQQVQAAQHQIQNYANQLAAEYAERFPEIQSLEDLQTVASFDRDRAIEAATYLQQAEQAITTQQQAVVGQQSLARRVVDRQRARAAELDAERQQQIDTEAQLKAQAAARKEAVRLERIRRGY